MSSDIRMAYMKKLYFPESIIVAKRREPKRQGSVRREQGGVGWAGSLLRAQRPGRGLPWKGKKCEDTEGQGDKTQKDGYGTMAKGDSAGYSIKVSGKDSKGDKLTMQGLKPEEEHIFPETHEKRETLAIQRNTGDSQPQGDRVGRSLSCSQRRKQEQLQGNLGVRPGLCFDSGFPTDVTV